MNTDNNDRLRQELRLAQLEIRVLREQLLKSVQEMQRAREQTEELSAPPMTPEAEQKIVPLPPEKTSVANGASKNGVHPRVLCIEDSEPNFRLIENVLRDRPGTDLAWAETGEKALAMARENPPHLVLLDLDLPDTHGSQVLKSLQAQPATADTPVIVISADATPSQIERMLAAGARNYLTKPFEIRRFLCMFDEILAARA
ncbi:MAG: response regulator [Chthoniobacterales bacterium]